VPDLAGRSALIFTGTKPAIRKFRLRGTTHSLTIIGRTKNAQISSTRRLNIEPKSLKEGSLYQGTIHGRIEDT
jgi:hypothetical protein